MALFKVGYQIHPQHCTVEQIREAYRAADSLGVDSIWVWDHMYPLYGDPEGAHYECYALLAAMAVETTQATIGSLVSGNSYRNPELLAYMVGTLDQLSGGRAILGLGAGWFERDYEEYGYEFGDVAFRLRELGRALPRVRSRLARLNPRPRGRVPVMIGGGGEKVTLKLTAQYADMWNTFPPLDNWRRKNEILDEWCAKVGRDPKEIERTCSIDPEIYGDIEDYLAAGVQHFIVRGAQPFNLAHVEEILKRSGR